MIIAELVRQRFKARYGAEPRLFWAPGRVNLIGEHTDYSGGFVLPMAIERGTWVAGRVRDDRRIRIFSLGVDDSREIDLNSPPQRRRGIWVDYAEGVARTLQARGHPVRGADLAVHGNVPVGAGLSSSASLEISIGLALLSLSGKAIDPMALALAGQAAEHEYVGTRCGIMDQAVAALAREGHAMLLDCQSLERTFIPINSSRAAVVICDSRVKHELASSEYNARRAECERAVALLRAVLPGIGMLRDVSVAELMEFQGNLPETLWRRSRHVVTENARTVAAAGAFQRGDFAEAGRLMLASHQSLRDDYEVSVPELDMLVEVASSVAGVFGARLTGGGFGGCTVNLVENDTVLTLTGVLQETFTRQFGHAPLLFVTRAGCGAREIV
jgi:galactokinase